VTPLTLDAVEAALRASWAADTCSPDDLERHGWTSANPARGHCDVTALVLHDLFGGDLVIGTVHLGDEQHGWHWWNRLATGTELDLTRDQFVDGETVTATEVLARRPGPLPHRWDAYLVLRARVAQRLGTALPDPL
jgi:hypothetical protein